jgi:hypothetical protein
VKCDKAPSSATRLDGTDIVILVPLASELVFNKHDVHTVVHHSQSIWTLRLSEVP